MNTNNLTLSAIEIWKSSFEIFKRYWKVFLGTAIVSFILQAISGIFSYVMYRPYEIEQYNELLGMNETVINYDIVPLGVSASVNLINVLVAVVGVILGYNLIKMILKMYNSQEVKISEYWQKPESDNFWKYIRTLLLFILKVILPLILVFSLYFILRFSVSGGDIASNQIIEILLSALPVIGILLLPLTMYWSVIYGQAIYLAIDDKASSANNAMYKSKEITEGKFWKIFWFNVRFGLIIFGIILLGLVALIVGVIPAAFIAMSTGYIMMINLYKKLYEFRYKNDISENVEVKID